MGSALDAYQQALIELRGLAYRMLGSVSDSEDVLQDVWLRWQEAWNEEIDEPHAYLRTITTRLCIDRLRSAKARRESYIGSWLPEPVFDTSAFVVPAIDETAELADELSFAFLLTLERLSAAERAAFLLHDVFAMPFTEIAHTLERSEAACRKLAARARKHVSQDRPRYSCNEEASQPMAKAFARAVALGKTEQLAKLLAAECRFISDGGGKVAAVPRVLVGAQLVAKVVIGFAKTAYKPDLIDVHAISANGLATFFVTTKTGEPVQTISLETHEGLISAIYVVRNPDKLTTPRNF